MHLSPWDVILNMFDFIHMDSVEHARNAKQAKIKHSCIQRDSHGRHSFKPLSTPPYMNCYE